MPKSPITAAFARAAGFPYGTSRDDVKANAIDKGVAEHVEGVGEQGHGSGEQARKKLDDKHHSVHEQNEAKSRRSAVAKSVDSGNLIGTAIVHDFDHAQASENTRPPPNAPSAGQLTATPAVPPRAAAP